VLLRPPKSLLRRPSIEGDAIGGKEYVGAGPGKFYSGHCCSSSLADPATTTALADAAGDNSWLVRAAALEALAKRGHPSTLDTVTLYMSDEKDVVKYTAALPSCGSRRSRN
jgi:hypothetical protein